MKKYTPIISVTLLTLTLLLIWFYPAASFALGIASLLFSIVLSVYNIFQTHDGTENVRPKILKETGLLVLALIMIFFTSTLLSASLGGVAGMLTNYQVDIRWGTMAGFVSAIVPSNYINTFPPSPAASENSGTPAGRTGTPCTCCRGKAGRRPPASRRR